MVTALLLSARFHSAEIAWGTPQQGVSLGLKVERAKQGPATFRLFFKSFRDETVDVFLGSTLDGRIPPRIAFSPHAVHRWEWADNAAFPVVRRGLTAGSNIMLKASLGAGAEQEWGASCFKLPVSAGRWTLVAMLDTPYITGRNGTAPATLVSGEVTVDLSQEECLAQD